MKNKTIVHVLVSSLIFLLFVSIGANWTTKISEPVTKEVEEKVMYLTIDDGPSINTEKTLEILDRYKVKATFFISGQNPDYFPMIKKAYKKGHVIAAHTYSHSFQEIYSGVDAYMSDLDKVNGLIKQYTGKESKIVRFPGGSSNTVSANYSQGIITSLVQELEKRDFQYYDWNASNGDGACGNDSQALLQQAIRESKDKNEVMLLMHDGTCNKGSLEALPSIIEYFKKEGYVFKVIDENTPQFHHKVAN